MIPPISPRDMIAVQSDEIEWLRDAIEDTTNDYDILRDLLYRIRHRLNDHPHSTDNNTWTCSHYDRSYCSHH